MIVSIIKIPGHLTMNISRKWIARLNSLNRPGVINEWPLKEMRSVHLNWRFAGGGSVC